MYVLLVRLLSCTAPFQAVTQGCCWIICICPTTPMCCLPHSALDSYRLHHMNSLVLWFPAGFANERHQWETRQRGEERSGSLLFQPWLTPLLWPLSKTRTLPRCHFADLAPFSFRAQCKNNFLLFLVAGQGWEGYHHTLLDPLTLPAHVSSLFFFLKFLLKFQ